MLRILLIVIPVFLFIGCTKSGLVADSKTSSALQNVNDIADPTPQAPTAPIGLNALPIAATQINLSWTDTSLSETGTKIERSTSSTGPFLLIATTLANVVTYSDTSLVGSTTYYYRIYAFNNTGSSVVTSVASATTLAPPLVAPSVPTALVASATTSAQINLAWLDNSLTEAGFKIERSTNSAGPFTLIATTAANVVNYSDSGLASSVKYYYRIYSFNSAGQSIYTAVVNATTQAPPVLTPSAPTTLAANATSSTQVNLTWMDTSTNETGFKIERSTNSAGPFTLIATTTVNAISYLDSGLAPSTTYYYRINSFNGSGASAYTSVVNVKTQASLLPPPVVIDSTLVKLNFSSLYFDPEAPLPTWTAFATNDTKVLDLGQTCTSCSNPLKMPLQIDNKSAVTCNLQSISLPSGISSDLTSLSISSGSAAAFNITVDSSVIQKISGIMAVVIKCGTQVQTINYNVNLKAEVIQ